MGECCAHRACSQLSLSGEGSRGRRDRGLELRGPLGWRSPPRTNHSHVSLLPSDAPCDPRVCSAPQMFDDSGFNRNTDGNWLLKATNIKVLIAQLANIYSSVLKKDASGHISEIDANAIAKDKDEASTQRLVYSSESVL